MSFNNLIFPVECQVFLGQAGERGNFQGGSEEAGTGGFEIATGPTNKQIRHWSSSVIRKRLDDNDEMNRMNGQPVEILILFNVFQTYLKSDYFLSPIVQICACWQKHCDDMLVLWSSSPPSSVHTRRALRVGISCSRLVTNSRGILSHFVNEKSSGMKISIYRCASYWRVVLL